MRYTAHRQNYYKDYRQKMASEKVDATEAIPKAVTEATRVAIKAMVVAATERPQNVGPKIGRPAMK